MTWSSDRYFEKAQHYWDKAYGFDHSEPDFVLFLAISCEFLIRGALCRVNPALNSALDSESILASQGIESKKPPRSIDIIEGLARTKRILTIISDDEINALRVLVSLRNEELHGDTFAAATVDVESLQSQIYSAALKLTNFADQDVNLVFGEENSAQMLSIAEARQKDLRERVFGLIRANKERFEERTEEERKELVEQFSFLATSRTLVSGVHQKQYKCPSCGSRAAIAGQRSGSSQPKLSDGEIIQEIRILSEYFECKVCGLALKGLEEIMSAGLPYEFRVTESLDPVEFLSIDPMEYVDVENIVRDYHYEHDNPYLDE